MGLVRDTKATTAERHAVRAAQEGRTVLLYRQNVGATSPGVSGPVGDVAEAIESQGWELAQMAYDERQSRHGGVLLFRLATSAPPPATHGYDAYYQDVPSRSYLDVPSGRHSHRRG